MADGRLSQLAVETLTQPVPAARVTQLAIEVLSSTVPIPGRVTQLAIEVLSENLAVAGGERIDLFIWLQV